ncbi:MAG TPA: hypothetical protein VFZ66_16725 [Herpetosiphonaceae bacterium]
MRRFAQALSMIVALLLGTTSAGVWWVARGMPEAWTIVVQQRDGNLLLVDEQGRTRPLTSDANGSTLIYRFPTPAPDGRSVAAVTLRHTSASIVSTLTIHRLDGEPLTLYDQPNSHPFYLSWSPDSRRLAFLANDPTGMTLHGVPLAAPDQAMSIAPGEPSYFSWSPNSQQLLLHIGGGAPSGSLQLYDWGATEPRALPAAPALFQAPGWLPEGQQALVVIRESSGPALVTIDGQGSVQRRLASVDENTLFVTAPDARHIAYLTFADDALGELHILRAADGDDQTIKSGVLTCFWSPAGDALAFLTLAARGETETISLAQERLRMRWNVLTLRDGDIRSFDLFTPSEEFLDLLPFFDQYAQSIRVWDRTGSRLLYASTSGVYSLDVASGQTQLVSQGVLGLWLDSAKERP